jgi:hypothetical protein
MTERCRTEKGWKIVERKNRAITAERDEYVYGGS